MMKTRWIAAVLVVGVVVLTSLSARADDELALYEGLVRGEAMNETEMDSYYGKGQEQFVLQCSSGNCVFAPEGNTSSQNINMNGTVTGNEGITSNQQFTGDNNNVSTTVMITVNIGTVTVIDSAGAMITVNQNTDVEGVVQGLGQ